MQSDLVHDTDDASDAGIEKPGVRRRARDAEASDYQGLLREFIRSGGPSPAGQQEVLRAQRAFPATSGPADGSPSADRGLDLAGSPDSVDALTGLPYRQALPARLDRLLKANAPKRGVTLLWIDLHRFRTINARFGHRVGDRALQEVAVRLRSAVGAHDFIARLGGDEFAVLLEGAADRPAVDATAQSIAALLDRPFAIEGHRFTIGACIGIAGAGNDAVDADDLMRKADQALREAKQDGRRSHRWFDGTLAHRSRLHNQIRADLAMAIVREELRLNYQPIVDIAKRRVIGFEALLRWDHPIRGRISPADFIPVAEETGLILPISDWVLKKACNDAAQWSDHLKVSVNLSPIQFKHGDPVHSVDRALAASGLPPRRLECEITESTIIQDVAQTLAAVRKIKSRGVTVSLDDFGTGYSSLNCLSMLPFDRIKIDRSFVTASEALGNTFAVLETIATLGRALGAATVLEGVETPEQLALAVHKGCSAVQGYLFSPPCSAAQVPDVIADVDGRAPGYFARIDAQAAL